MPEKSFSDYKEDKYEWITLGPAGYYPDYVSLATQHYGSVLTRFQNLLTEATDSTDLYRKIMAVRGPTRIQLCRIFRKYVSPAAPVELLKTVKNTDTNIEGFQHLFRSIGAVRAAFATKPMPDEGLCLLLWEYKDRGEVGYDLTENLFQLLRTNLKDMTIHGPERAGPDIQLKEVWPDYPRESRPVDFMIKGEEEQVMAVGLARYDSDRGGAQEDDRTGQYRETAREIIGFANSQDMTSLKVIFINDGPGLLAGSMWDDYARIDTMLGNRVRVATLKMVQERITPEWLES